MEVILKPLEGMLANIGGYVGTALLGDGRVLLVLDLKELIP
jgi:two-component system chemotaxis sensor kinase CheA